MTLDGVAIRPSLALGGWVAFQPADEAAIPTKSLRFRNLPVTEWGFWIFRNYPRDTRHQLASHKMNRSDPCWACQFDHLDSLSGLQPACQRRRSAFRAARYWRSASEKSVEVGRAGS